MLTFNYHERCPCELNPGKMRRNGATEVTPFPQERNNFPSFRARHDLRFPSMPQQLEVKMIRISACTEISVQSVDFRHLIFRKREVKDLKIRNNALFVVGLG